jgi:hypothetical protein
MCVCHQCFSHVDKCPICRTYIHSYIEMNPKPDQQEKNEEKISNKDDQEHKTEQTETEKQETEVSDLQPTQSTTTSTL